MSRPLELTPSSHGVALGAYWLALLLGASYLIPGLNESPAMVRALTRTGFHLWATGMAACGFLALACAVLALRMPTRLERHLTRLGFDRSRRVLLLLAAELAACVGLALTFALYLYGLTAPQLADLPPTASTAEIRKAVLTTLTTKLLATTYVVGGTVRVVQIALELRKWRKGVAAPRPATPAPLADPDQ